MSGPLPFPAFDPVAIAIGPFAIRWYALAYIAGLLAGWWWAARLARLPGSAVPPAKLGDFLTWAIVGIIAGGRLGYVLFYQPSHFLAHPVEIVYLWQGGMSFHGGLAGIIAAIILFARANSIPVLALGDLVAAAGPIGLFLGRLANFVNGELFGRPTDVPWAIVFPNGGPEGRHPSQLYEAALEGVVLFAVLAVLMYRPWVRARPGIVAGGFVAGYGIARFIVEFFRQPDAFLGFLAFGATMGQLLSLPLIAIGAGFIVWGLRHPLPGAAAR
ncbi:MAG: prolipoprotein diacylglyceryl transferase [Alphaproteobacteria bacterium]